QALYSQAPDYQRPPPPPDRVPAWTIHSCIPMPRRLAATRIPLFPGDASAFGRALVLIFWAYAGFELSTLPTDEVIEPRKTIPRAILMGMVIVIAFYFLTNFFVIGTVRSEERRVGKEWKHRRTTEH